MALPDNRIRLPAVKIDFANDVGLASQDHDTYPPAGGQARFDHMRMYLIGLLSQQSSYDEPTQKRDGTPWFDYNTLSLKIWLDGSWRPYSDTIQLTDELNLTQWYSQVSLALSTLSPELVFGGRCTTVGISEITIPENLRSNLHSDSRVFMTVNSTPIDPREVQLIGTPIPTTIRLNTIELETNDTFLIQIRRVSDNLFYTPDVTIP